MPIVFGEGAVAAMWVAGIALLLAWAVAFGLHWSWVNTFGKIFSSIGNAGVRVPHITTVHPFGFLNDLSNAVANAFLSLANKSEAAAGQVFHGAAVVQAWAVSETFHLGRDVLQWMTWVQRAHLPRWTKALIYAAFPPFLVARLVKAAIAANLPHLGRTIITRVEHTVTHTITRIGHATTGALALPGYILHLPGRVGRLERELARVWKARKELIGLLGATGALALVARAFRRSGLSCLLGKNAKKIAPSICGINDGLLSSLLADVLVIASVISVVEFAKELQSIEGECVKVLGAGIREFPG